MTHPRLSWFVVLLVLLWGHAHAHHPILTADLPTATGAYGETAFLDVNENNQILARDLTPAAPRTLVVTDLYAPTQRTQVIVCPDGSETFGEAINRRGDVAGYCNGQAFLSIRGQQVHTRTVDGASATYGMGVNDQRQVVGFYEQGGVFHGFRWAGASVTTLDVPFPEATATFPTAINRRGDVVGYYQDNVPIPDTLPSHTHGFRCRNTQCERLDVPLPDVWSTVLLDITDQGVILGWVQTATQFAQVMYYQGQWYYAKFSAPSFVTTLFFGLNNRLQVAGHHTMYDEVNTTDPFYDYGVLSLFNPAEAQTVVPTTTLQSADVRQALVGDQSQGHAAWCQTVTRLGGPTGVKGLGALCGQVR